MAYNPEIHNRRSIRKKGYDYTQAGAYFVTVCTKHRQPVLVDSVVAGILKDVWIALPHWFPTIGLDEFVIMPNHAHFIIWLMVDPDYGINDDAKPLSHAPRSNIQIYGQSQALPADPRWSIPKAKTTIERPHLGDVVGAWKSLVTKIYLDWVKVNAPSRRAKFWQRNYYERIVRDDRALLAIRRYIRDNPKDWRFDPDNGKNIHNLLYPETIDDYLDDVRRHFRR